MSNTKTETLLEQIQRARNESGPDFRFEILVAREFYYELRNESDAVTYFQWNEDKRVETFAGLPISMDDRTPDFILHAL